MMISTANTTTTSLVPRRRWVLLELSITVALSFFLLVAAGSSVDALSSTLPIINKNKNKKSHHSQKNVGALVHHQNIGHAGDGGEEEGSRRSFLQESVGAVAVAVAAAAAAAAFGAGLTTVPAFATAAATQPDLNFQTTSSGLQWADVKVGTGTPLSKGGSATIDYSMATTGARYGTKIYSTANTDNPYRFKIGDGSTIVGIEQAIVGSENLPPMLPGGIRRLIIPSSNGLGYTKLASNPKELCVQGGRPGPIPPPNEGAFEEYQRFKNIYCNSERQYQPDVVIDIKLYGPRR
mmetsp:Transcript_8685/g.21803  ORF Transcript_8685/g.21803 Transcript_8685/m.21803 type:complete len:293 (+) Transcript_8685:178-1056(+)